MSSYPPERHFLADLAAVSTWVDAHQLRVEAEVEPSWCGPTGACRLGMIAALVDIAGAQVALTATDHDWVATADLSLSLGAMIRPGPVEIVASEVRVGQKSIVVGVDLGGGATGRAMMTFARIPGSATAVTGPTRARVVGEPRRSHDRRSSLQIDVFDAVGIEPRPDGAVIELGPYVANSIGTLNGGVVALLSEAAALAGRTAQATDLTVRYLSQARTGSYVALAREVRSTAATAVVEVSQRATATDAVTSIATLHLDVG